MKINETFHIFYVAPEADISLLRAFFRGLNIHITGAGTIREALEMSGMRDFDLFLLETRFADGSGFDLCRSLRERHSNAPIVFYSGDARKSDRKQGLEMGADAYLVKPHFDRLISALNEFINGEKNISSAMRLIQNQSMI